MGLSVLVLASLCPMVAGCVVLPGLGIDASPDPGSVILTERDDAQGLARAHVITFLEAARREERVTDRVLGDGLGPDGRLILSYRIALAARVDAGTLTPDEADRRTKLAAARLGDPAARDAEERRIRALIPVRAAPFASTFDREETAAVPRNVCMGMTFYGVVGTRCALGDR